MECGGGGGEFACADDQGGHDVDYVEVRVVGGEEGVGGVESVDFGGDVGFGVVGVGARGGGEDGGFVWRWVSRV